MQVDQSDADLMYKLGHEKRGVDDEKAAYYLKIAADQNHIKALNEYAIMLYKGDGIPKDLEKAAFYIKKGADNGVVVFNKNYAEMCYNGYLATKDKEKAAIYYKRGADANVSKCSLNYAKMLYQGDGIDKNYAEANKYFKKAIEIDGDNNSYFEYANFLLDQSHDFGDLDKSLEYFKKAADNGNLNAMKTITIIYMMDAIPFDKQDFYKYLKMAADKDEL